MMARVGASCAASDLSRLNRTVRNRIGLTYPGPLGQEAVWVGWTAPLLLQLGTIEMLLCEECSMWKRPSPVRACPLLLAVEKSPGSSP
jgi:hypothetical protein